MNEIKSEPTKCPSCGRGLWTIGVVRRLDLVFDKGRNGYEVHNGEDDLFCPECDASLLNVFPDGLNSIPLLTRKSIQPP